MEGELVTTKKYATSLEIYKRFSSPTSVSNCYRYNLPQEADKDHSAVTAGTAVSLSNPEDHVSSKVLHCMEKLNYGDFYTIVWRKKMNKT